LPFISIITPCCNEEENVEILHDQIVQVMSDFPNYNFEHIYKRSEFRPCSVFGLWIASMLWRRGDQYGV
jgi:glycosyltransferase involved in cell wall biosynthesis